MIKANAQISFIGKNSIFHAGLFDFWMPACYASASTVGKPVADIKVCYKHGSHHMRHFSSSSGLIPEPLSGQVQLEQRLTSNYAPDVLGCLASESLRRIGGMCENGLHFQTTLESFLQSFHCDFVPSVSVLSFREARRAFFQIHSISTFQSSSDVRGYQMISHFLGTAIVSYVFEHSVKVVQSFLLGWIGRWSQATILTQDSKSEATHDLRIYAYEWRASCGGRQLLVIATQDHVNTPKIVMTGMHGFVHSNFAQTALTCAGDLIFYGSPSFVIQHGHFVNDECRHEHKLVHCRVLCFGQIQFAQEVQVEFEQIVKSEALH